MTLIHGAGVDCPASRTVTYSRPSAENPPKTVEELELRRAGATGVAPAAKCIGARLAGRRQSRFLGARAELLGERAAPADQHDARNGEEQGRASPAK